MGLTGPQRLETAGRVVTRTVDEVAASVHSLSWAAHHLSGDHFPAWSRELRDVPSVASDNGMSSERMRGITLSIWRRPPAAR